MNDRRFNAELDRLRSPERVARLEIARVAQLCLGGIAAKSVLDVGTGTGVFAEAFAAHGLEVTGIDVNPEMVNAAQQFVPKGRFQVAPAEAIPYLDKTFDLAFLGCVLHETDDPLKALREARRVARLRTAVLEWPFQRETFGPPLAHRMRPEQIRPLAEQAGYRAVEILPLAHMVFYRLSI